MNVAHDKELEVATANSRRAKSWKNKKVAWSWLLERMSITTRTAETLAEYRAMGRDEQSQIKDTGAFVGGYCNNGSRSDIRFRSVLALDADFAQEGLWDDWGVLYGAAAAVYSTHKHTPEKPRLRLVVPLSRNVTPDEYQAIGRRVAADLGIDQFDDSTYQPQRCMFWPSTSSDGEFVFQYLDGPFLDADAVLATYHDWKDMSAWPMSSRVAEIAKKAASKQADPLTKGGLVGAFCRAYGIAAAVEKFLPEVYVPCSEPGRYTYALGSTAAGVVVYEDKFVFSHHATDPASGALCNAWDMVRLHLFGEQDMDYEPGKPVASRPSWKSMTELAAADDAVKAQILADRNEEVMEAFDSTPAEEEGSWTKKLRFTKDGAVASTIDNVVVILAHDPKLAGRLAYDDMSHNIVSLAPLPWRKELGQWTDADDSALRYYLEKSYGLSGRDKIFDAVNVSAMNNRFHPVRDYLDSCAWDDVPRVDTLLIDYLGAEDSPYTRAVTRKTLVAAVARIYNPGCKFDYILTFRGAQGIGKSTLVSRLGGKWYSDSFSTMAGKDAYEALQGCWLLEMGELAGLKKSEAETIKLFISKQVDRFRPAYGRRTQEFPRQCIFIGTTNETAFLRDTTGNRRFWVVDTPNEATRNLWEELTPEMVRCIWAEAVQMYRNGEDLFLPPDLEAVARDTQEAYEEENPKEGLVADYLDRLLPANWDSMDLYDRRQWLEGSEVGTVQRERVCCVEIWAEALGGSPEKMDRYAVNEIMGMIARVGGWERQGNRRATISPYGRQKYYTRSVA